MIVYRSDDAGTLYSSELILSENIVNDTKGNVSGFTQFEIEDKFELTANQCLGHYADITEILLDAGKMRKI